MKNLLAATAIGALLVTQTYAGDAVMEPPAARAIQEPDEMGMSAATWLIPLLAIGLIALAMSNNSPAPSDSRLKTDIVPEGFAPNGLGPRHDQHAHAWSHSPPIENAGCRPQIFDPSVGAAADKDHIHRQTLEGATGGNTHII